MFRLSSGNISPGTRSKFVCKISHGTRALLYFNMSVLFTYKKGLLEFMSYVKSVLYLIIL